MTTLQRDAVVLGAETAGIESGKAGDGNAPVAVQGAETPMSSIEADTL